MKTFLFLTTFLIIPFLPFAQPPDIQINPNFTWNGENSLAVNPTNPDNLIVAWMKLTSFTQVTIAVSRSVDGGITWLEPVYMPHFSSSFTSADPTLVFANDGTAYFGYIDYNKTSLDSGSVYVCKSMDGGATWSQPVSTIDVHSTPDWGIDRPWLAVDNSGGAYNGRLYLVTKGGNDAPLPHHIYLLTSSDGGATWTNPKRIDQEIPVGPQSNSMGVPAVSANGTFSVAYLSYDPSSSLYVRNIIVQSPDGGNSFSTHVIDILPLASIIPPEDTLYQYSYYLAANPAMADNLVFIYTDRRNGDLDILSTSSIDGGMTWNSIQRINDDPLGNGIAQDMCWGGFSPDGRFVALWRDRRDGTPSQSSDYRIYGSWSTDGGATFHPDFALSQTAGSLAIPIDGNDFLGVAVTDSMISGTWADKRSFSNQVWFNRHAFSTPSTIWNSEKTEHENFLPQLIQSDCATLIPGKVPYQCDYEVLIFNYSGIKVSEFHNEETICFEHFTNGLYIAILLTNKGMAIQRITISK